MTAFNWHLETTQCLYDLDRTLSLYIICKLCLAVICIYKICKALPETSCDFTCTLWGTVLVQMLYYIYWQYKLVRNICVISTLHMQTRSKNMLGNSFIKEPGCPAWIVWDCFSLDEEQHCLYSQFSQKRWQCQELFVNLEVFTSLGLPK